MKFKNTSKPNVVCFPDFGLGGIICTILNNSDLVFNDSRLVGSTKNNEHNALKDVTDWDAALTALEPDRWYGTHNEYGTFPTKNVGNIIQITTENIQSRFIIFLRAYQFLKPDWVENNTLDSIDPIRELAKQYALPYIIKKKKQCYNIELIDLVTNPKLLFEDLTVWNHWLEKNQYLVSPSVWATNRFNEALWEIIHQQPYKYS